MPTPDDDLVDRRQTRVSVASDAGSSRASFPFVPGGVVERQFIDPAGMSGDRAARCGDDEVAKDLAILVARDRQAGDELVRSRRRNAQLLQLLLAASGFPGGLHRRQQQSNLADRLSLFQVQQAPDDTGERPAVLRVGDNLAVQKLLRAEDGDSRPLQERRRRLTIARLCAAAAGGESAYESVEVPGHLVAT